MPRYKCNLMLEENPLVTTCSTIACKNKPIKVANELPFCNYCFDKLVEAGMVISTSTLPLHVLEYKGVRNDT
jgi:hypothetical protein